ncbi:hypothetical protein PIB30_030428 [Stylosanthes scabra]|uniref:Stress-response A/B barrel domain-containing protein n=1 Tax=Stylosanthes scabra TaxID=79078 RepID=A0ABU6QB08_9FABA|nr:hypothetical protein [Stylosanthes scabra]
MGMNEVKSVTAICRPLPTRVRILRHGFNLVRKRMSVFPGDSENSPSFYNLAVVSDSRHAGTAGEFIPVTRVYSSPSDHRDVQYFNPWPDTLLLSLSLICFHCTLFSTIKLQPTPIEDKHLVFVTHFLNDDRVREKAFNDKPHPELRHVFGAVAGEAEMLFVFG